MCTHTKNICYFRRTWAFLPFHYTWNCVRSAAVGCLCQPFWPELAFVGERGLLSDLVRWENGFVWRFCV